VREARTSRGHGVSVASSTVDSVESRRMGRRILRYLVVGLVLLLLGGLWAFSFFLFNPFEGRYEYSIATLIPRDVDFYASKSQLGRDFDPFPRLAFLDEFEGSPGGQAVMDLGLRETVASWNVEQSLAELERVLEELPIRIDPLALFGGRGLALAGFFGGPSLAGARWAVYGRTSWLGKLAVELVDGGWALSGQGIEVERVDAEDEGKGVRLSGGQLQQPIFLARIRDIVIVSNTADMLGAADEFEGGDQQALARPGFARDGVEPVSEGELGTLDEGQVGDGELEQHGNRIPGGGCGCNLRGRRTAAPL